MNKDLRLMEMLSTRMCHDLTGPIGAVSNGAEFMSDEGFDLQGQAIELIVDSAREAVSRLQFYRMAYGRVNDKGEASLSEKKILAENFLAGTKIKLDWPDQYTDASDVSVGNKMARLLLNMIIITQATMIRGGTLSIRLNQHSNGDKEMHVQASGPSIKWEDISGKVLDGKVDIMDIDPGTVQIYLTYMLGQELGLQLQHEAHEEGFRIVALQRHSNV